MAVSSVTGNSNAFNNQYATQGAAEANNSEMSMDDFWQLMAAQLQYQDMTNPMSNSEMMNQMTQMATMNDTGVQCDRQFWYRYEQLVAGHTDVLFYGNDRKRSHGSDGG